MNQTLNLISWNVKGIRTKEKSDRLCQVMRRKKEVTCWCIQEHHQGAMTLCKQTLGELVFFYALGEDGSSGVCMAINRELHTKVVFKHPFGGALGMQNLRHFDPFCHDNLISEFYMKCFAYGVLLVRPICHMVF